MVAEPRQAMSEEELRASVSEFVANLSRETGVALDFEEVWLEVKSRMAKS